MTTPTQYIGSPPPEFIIPVTLGADKVFTVQSVDDTGNPTDWTGTVQINVGLKPPVDIDAAITADQAVITIPSATCDLVKGSTLWQITMTQGGVTTAIAVGTFERNDG